MKHVLLTLSLSLLGLTAAVSGDPDPASQWLNAYAWIQTADNLSTAGQWPLALGSYMEAHRQLKKLAAEHPSYEPEIVAYRLERLESSMANVEEKLTAGDHDITMEWVDFIESFEKGQSERFANDFKSAFATLDVARTLLEGIIAQNPNGFESAVQTQFEILTESLEWLDSQINHRQAMRRTVSLDDGTDWGTTKYVKESDLPKNADELKIDSMLFPDGAKPVPEDRKIEENPEELDVEPPPGGIRLNTKDQSEIPGSE